MYFNLKVYTHNLELNSVSSFVFFFFAHPKAAHTPTPRQQQISTGTSRLGTQATTTTPTTIPIIAPIGKTAVGQKD